MSVRSCPGLRFERGCGDVCEEFADELDMEAKRVALTEYDSLLNRGDQGPTVSTTLLVDSGACRRTHRFDATLTKTLH